MKYVLAIVAAVGAFFGIRFSQRSQAKRQEEVNDLVEQKKKEDERLQMEVHDAELKTRSSIKTAELDLNELNDPELKKL